MATTEHDDVEVTSTRAAPLEGDDITVIPEPADTPKRNRRRVVLLSALAVMLIAAVIAIVVGTRDDSSPQVQAASPSPAVTSPPAVKKHKPAAPKKKHASKPVTRVTTAPVVVLPNVPATAPPVVIAPTTPATMPAQPQASPISVLQWHVPAAVSVKSGATTSIAVSAYNPSNGVVTLPVPLSCAPRLHHDEVCPEMAQLVNPGETANATYTIDATGVKRGTYTLKVEGIAPITVTVA